MSSKLTEECKACGHVENEHGGRPDPDPQCAYLGSTACTVHGCVCFCFERVEDADPCSAS